ncbi:glycoside hydrolase family 19 protein [Luteimonas sp. R10]|uniref:glycoside hydrolase family 19 protein n=1 Tax=Luteimonas sp. R10 TaxID=3108176 RepID=UPI00308FB9B1|nr:glycoside hydrolase family 19 protein [Luteimonas sp. R10]
MTNINAAVSVLNRDFDVFDTAHGALNILADGRISAKDLEAVAANADGRFTGEQQEAAQFLLDNPAHLNMLDVAAGIDGVDGIIGRPDLRAIMPKLESGGYLDPLLDTAASTIGQPGGDGVSNRNDVDAALRDPGLNPELRQILQQQGVDAAAPVDASAATDPSASVTAAQLQQIVPTLSAEKAAEIAPHISTAMAEANINTPQRKAMFIAQLAHESGGFHYSEEIASGAAYEGRADLGNTQPGDGVRFKGRGYIQLTGRANYEAAGQALGLDLVNNPELAAQPENAARVAAWYWGSRDINAAADAGDFRQVTRLINGGYNGLEDRQAYYSRAQAALQ